MYWSWKQTNLIENEKTPLWIKQNIIYVLRKIIMLYKNHWIWEYNKKTDSTVPSNGLFLIDAKLKLFGNCFKNNQI